MKKLTKPMTLDNAIIHANERAAQLSGECATEHRQLASWLQELSDLRARVAELEAGPKFIATIKRMSELAEAQGLVEELGNTCNHQWIRSEGRTASGWICNKCGDYEGPAPAINLAELVPREVPKDVCRVIYQQCGGFVDSDANAQTIWTCCRAAILSKLESDK